MATPQPAPERENLAGLVERVTFHNENSGFCVLRVKAHFVALHTRIWDRIAASFRRLASSSDVRHATNGTAHA